MTERYDDIIDFNWEDRNSERKKMELTQRAKIFLPFAALTGFETALEDTLEYQIKSFERLPGKELF